MQTLQLARKANATPKSPIGLLKVVFILGYGTPGSVVIARLDVMGAAERTLLLGFLMFYPLVILSVLYLLVSRHYSKLYTPYDFRKEAHFLALARLLISKPMKIHAKRNSAVEELPGEAGLGPLTLEPAPRIAADEASVKNELDLPAPSRRGPTEGTGRSHRSRTPAGG
ncbi:hypothetical protein [Nannocystis bainbridge]|uniref:Uncharacterized protein n=1 Tax=Nannocystis bainbridge TaxID=2995303 RepID=A0ABT5DR82_9BACT|nr:hypothetical protein [Nannocystis bainbridge]MDC0716123.1 hypothetical protein [Nannocystis bainbridge]